MTVAKEVSELKVAFAKLETRQEATEKYLSAIAKDVRVLRDTANSVSGGWKIIVLLGSVSAAVGALFAKVAPLLMMAPK